MLFDGVFARNATLVHHSCCDQAMLCMRAVTWNPKLFTKALAKVANAVHQSSSREPKAVHESCCKEPKLTWVKQA